MAGDGGHGHRRVDGRVTKKVQKELGFLVVPLKQRPLDSLGRQRSGLCSDCAAVCFGGDEYSRRREESITGHEFLKSVPGRGRIK